MTSFTCDCILVNGFVQMDESSITGDPMTKVTIESVIKPLKKIKMDKIF